MPATETIAGLRGADAAERLRRDGPNTLPVAAGVSWARRLAGQLFHFFALMLWAAALLALVAGLPQLSAAIGWRGAGDACGRRDVQGRARTRARA